MNKISVIFVIQFQEGGKKKKPKTFQMESEWQTIKRELISSFLKSRFIMVDFHLKILKKWEEKKNKEMPYDF